MVCGADATAGSRHTPHPVTGSAPDSRAGRTARLPFESQLALGARPTAVPRARLHARLVVSEWGLAALADLVELVTSELVTNAVQASTGLLRHGGAADWRPDVPSVRLTLRSDGARVVTVECEDSCGGTPQRKQPSPQEEHGRGLLLVDAIAEATGVDMLAGGGKVVWALVTA